MRTPRRRQPTTAPSTASGSSSPIQSSGARSTGDHSATIATSSLSGISHVVQGQAQLAGGALQGQAGIGGHGRPGLVAPVVGELRVGHVAPGAALGFGMEVGQLGAGIGVQEVRRRVVALLVAGVIAEVEVDAQVGGGRHELVCGAASCAGWPGRRSAACRRGTARRARRRRRARGAPVRRSRSQPNSRQTRRERPKSSALPRASAARPVTTPAASSARRVPRRKSASAARSAGRP